MPADSRWHLYYDARIHERQADVSSLSKSSTAVYTSFNFFCYSGDGGNAGGGRQKCRVTLQRDTSRPRQSLHGVLVQGRRWHSALQVSDLNIILVSMVYPASRLHFLSSLTGFIFDTIT